MKKNVRSFNRSAAFEPATVSKENRTVEIVWTTGSRVFRSNFFDGPFYEELSLDASAVRMDRLNNGAPFLNSHNQDGLDSILGVVEKAWLTPTEGRAVVRFSNRADVEPIFQDVASGIIRNISVGYRINKLEKVSEIDSVPVYRAIDWEPFELSAVAVGADAAAGFRKDNEEMNQVEIVEEKKEELREEPKTETTEAKVEAVKEKIEEKKVEEKTEEAPKVEEAPRANEEELIKREAVKSERERVKEIFEICHKAKLTDEVAREFVSTGAAIDNVRKEVIKMTETKNNVVVTQVEAGAQDEKQTRALGIENALLHRHNPGANKLDEKGRQYIGMSLLRMAEEFVPNARGMSKHTLAQRALSTSDFPNLLANVAEKTLRNGYAIQAKTFMPFVRIGTLPDYKAAKRIAFGEAPQLEKVYEGGEYKQGSMSESSESIQVYKHGKIVSLNDEVLINDDLNAFTRLTESFGAAAARLESKLIYTDILVANPTMSDSVALFHASHGNLPSAAAISVTSLGLAKALMRKQKGIDSQDYLDIEPAFLVCGPDKETEARQVLYGQILASQDSSTNPFKNTMQLIVDSRISGNKWFLVAQPSLIDTIELAYLDGMSGPEISMEKDFDNDGVKFKCKHIVGAKAIDYRGMVYNSGS